MCETAQVKSTIPPEKERERDVDDLIFPDPRHLPSDR